MRRLHPPCSSEPSFPVPMLLKNCASGTIPSCPPATLQSSPLVRVLAGSPLAPHDPRPSRSRCHRSRAREPLLQTQHFSVENPLRLTPLTFFTLHPSFIGQFPTSLRRQTPSRLFRRRRVAVPPPSSPAHLLDHRGGIVVHPIVASSVLSAPSLIARSSSLATDGIADG